MTTTCLNYTSSGGRSKPEVYLWKAAPRQQQQEDKHQYEDYINNKMKITNIINLHENSTAEHKKLKEHRRGMGLAS